jgi:hypothetical protein
LLFFVCCVVLIGAGCHRRFDSSRALTVEHEVLPQPARVGPVTVTFSLKDAAAKPLTGAHITLEGDMSHPGMSPVFDNAVEIAPGRYQSHLVLGMAGDWVILLHGTLADGEQVEQQFDIMGVQPN